MVRLRFVTDVEGASSIDLIERTITVGREESNLVCIADPGISKNHALLIHDSHGYKLFDLHSANGTWVNGERITNVRLNDGDIVRFGHLELQYETAAKKTTAGVKKISLSAPAPEPSLKVGDSTTPKKLALPSEQPVIAPKRLAGPSDQPVIAPKKLASEPPTDSPRIRLKRD